MDVARNLGEFTADITGDPAGLPSAVTGQCRDMMLNAAAAALAGAAHPDGVALTRFVREMGGNGRCTIIGMGMRTSPCTPRWSTARWCGCSTTTTMRRTPATTQLPPCSQR